MVRIPEDKIGLVKKKYVLVGSKKELPPDRIVALEGEAGFQADTLAPGLYFGLWPWQYSVTQQTFTVIPEGQLGLVIARDGASLDSDRILGKRVECDNFQDSRKFLTQGGQKGRQSAVILTGTYRVNTLLFEVQMVPITKIPPNQVGVVTTQDGKPLKQGEIAGDLVAGHNNYQDFDKFIGAGGFRGLQQQVLLAGAWNLNPWAVTVKIIEMLDIPIGYVGVVNSFVGEEGRDVSGVEFEHGNIVSKGQRGVWNETLGPGKYAINPFIMSVELVPTTNLVLNWATARTESHKLDENLSTITVRSKDGFKFNLDVSQIIHVPAIEAPKVIARFGNMKNLVSQVLEPTIGNYFRNSAQDSDVISFLSTRQERQRSARDHIEGVLKQYNVKAVDTLIGDITPPDSLMETLTNRKLAQENKATYLAQKEAQEQRQELEKQRSLADIQERVVQSQQGIQIAQNNADATAKKAEGDAKAVKLSADAEANRIALTGKAEAEKIEAIGKANATAYELQTKAMGQDNFTRLQVIDKISGGNVRIMPDTLITGGNNGGSNIMDGILAQFLLMSKNSNGEQKK
jgi:uncharacterized membrane protein YqiK